MAAISPWALLTKNSSNIADLDPTPVGAGPDVMASPSISMLNAPSRNLMDMNRGPAGRSPGLPPGSKTAHNTTSSDDEKSVDKTNSYKSNDMLASQIASIMGQGPLAQQSAGIDAQQALLQKQAEAAANKSHIDFSPLAAWVDANNSQRGIKTNFAGGMTAPENDLSELQTGMQKIQAERAAQQNEVNAGLKNLVDGYKLNQDQNKGSTNIINQIGGATGSAANSPVNNYDKWNKEVDKNLGKSTDSLNQMVQLQSELSSKNPIDDNRIATIRAKLDAGGRPNMAEIQNETGDPALASKFAQAFDKATTGNMSEKNRGLYLESVNNLVDLQNQIRDKQAARLAEMGKGYGISDENIQRTLPQSFRQIGGPVPGAANAQAPAPMDQDTFIQKYLAAKKAGGN